MKRTLAKRNLLTALLFLVVLASAVFAAVFASRPLTASAAGEGMQVALSLQSDLVLKITAEEAESLTVYVRGTGGEELNKAELTERNGEGQFEYRGVTPQLMNNAVVIADESGTEKEFTVKDYCEQLIAGTGLDTMSPAKREALQTLAADILNYGAAAQAYAESGYATEEAANAGLTAEQRDISSRYEAQAAPETVKGSTGEGTDGIYIRSAGVRFDNNAGIYFTVVSPEGTEGLGLQVELNGRSETLTEFAATDEAGVYTVLYEDIYIAEYGMPVTARAVKSGEEIGNEVTYSVNSYVASKADGSDMALSDLVKSLYVFNQSALAYETADDDPAEPVKYIFEAESADFVIENPKWGIKWGGESNDNGASGRGFLTGWSGSGRGNQIVFDITSDSDAEAVIGLCMGRRTDWDIYVWSESGSNMFSSLTLRGEEVTLPNDYFPKTPDGPDYFDWMEKDIATVDLKQGKNTFVFTIDDDNMNWDYLTVTTTAKVEWTREAEVGHQFSDWMVSVMPGEDTEGSMFRYCGTCSTREELTLPDLSTAGAYETKTLREATEYLNGLTEYTYHAADGDKVFIVESAPATGAIKDNKIEAETAVLGDDWDSGISVNIGSTTIDEQKIDFLQLNNRKGDMSWTVEVSETATVTLVLGVAGYQRKDICVNDLLLLTIDGKTAGMRDEIVPSGESTGGTWYEFNDHIVATFDLTAGEHVVTLQATGGNSYNLDYLLFRSAADISLQAA